MLRRFKLKATVLICLGLATLHARAGLFDDEEARKAILDLRARIASVDEGAKTRHAELLANTTQLNAQLNAQVNAQLNEQLQVLRRSLLDLNNQLEAMRGELAKLRGADETLAREVAELQRKQADAGKGLEERVRMLEPVKASVDGREVQVDQAEKRAFDDAMAVLRGGDFDKASAALGGFVRRYGGGPFGDTARYWLGNALYGKRDHKEAIAAFRNFVATAPNHPRAGEALLAVANSQAEMKDKPGARKTIEELLKTYPSTEAAQAGKDRLAALK